MNTNHPPLSTRCVVTLATGELGARLSRISFPLMRSYAEKIKADFTVLLRPDPGSLPPRYGKLLLAELFEVYQRILFLDADILVAPSSPNLFELVPPEKVGAVRIDRLTAEEAPAIENGWIRTDQTLIQRSLGDVGWTEPYFNAGVMVFSRVHRDVFHHARETSTEWASVEEGVFTDQTLLNYWVVRLGHEVQDLSHNFNHTPAFGRRGYRLKSHFIHYVRLRAHRRGNRFRQMKVDRWILERPRIHGFLARHPFLSRGLDRVWPIPEKIYAPWRIFEKTGW